jgi:hypothetical protein
MFQYFLKVVKSTYKSLDGKTVGIQSLLFDRRSPALSTKLTNTALRRTSEISQPGQEARTTTDLTLCMNASVYQVPSSISRYRRWKLYILNNGKAGHILLLRESSPLHNPQ